MHYHLPIACLRGDPLSINQLVAKGHLSFQWCGESGEVFQFFRMKGMELQYFFGGVDISVYVILQYNMLVPCAKNIQN